MVAKRKQKKNLKYRANKLRIIQYKEKTQKFFFIKLLLTKALEFQFNDQIIQVRFVKNMIKN